MSNEMEQLKDKIDDHEQRLRNLNDVQFEIRQNLAVNQEELKNNGKTLTEIKELLSEAVDIKHQQERLDERQKSFEKDLQNNTLAITKLETKAARFAGGLSVLMLLIQLFGDKITSLF